MGVNLFYKVRGEKINTETGVEIRITEKGLLRFLRTPKSRANLRDSVERYLKTHDYDCMYGVYLWDVQDRRQIAFFTPEFIE
jgi:hypothetical protein